MGGSMGETVMAADFLAISIAIGGKYLRLMVHLP
jgi:hypothetical protein